MKKHAIELALERLQKAQSALQALGRARTHSQMESAWSDFLVAANTVYLKLEKGSKGHGASESWFGRVKHERKTDPLLSYIHQARNSDEHGIERITERQHGSVAIGGDVILNGTIGGANTNLRISPIEGGRPPSVKIVPPHVKLVPVTHDQFGDTFQVPTSHLGQQLNEQSPLEVASLALAYLRKIVEDGSKFAL